MATRRKFDCRGLTGFFIITFSPVLTGISSSSYVEVGLGGTNSFGTMEMGIRVRGDDTFSDFENQGGVGNASGGTSGWIYNTTVLGNRAEDEPFTFFFEFAPDVIRYGQIYEGELRYFTAKYATAPQSYPYTQVWSPLIRVNQDSGDSAFRCDIYACHLWIDDINKWIGENRSFYTDATLTYVSGTHYAITGLRYQQTTFREIYVPVNLIGMDFVCTNNTGNYALNIIKNPTIAGSTTWVAQTNSPVEVLDGVLANTITGGQLMYTSVFDERWKKVPINLPSHIPLNEDDELIISVDFINEGGNGFGCVNWIEY